MAKRNSARRGRSRKRRPSPQGASDQPSPAKPAVRPAKPNAGTAAGTNADDERPQAPWHPLPLSELLIFVGILGTVVAWLRGIGSNGPLLGAGIGAVVIGTLEFSLREHLAGFRSHTMMLAVVPAVVLHSAVVLLVLAASGHAPRWLNLALIPVDLAVVAVCVRLLRARYADARRERTFAGLR